MNDSFQGGSTTSATGFWRDTLPNIACNPPLRGTSRCDVAIVGGGFTGLSAAYHTKMLMPGANVCVLEADVCGFGASGRCGGFSGRQFGMNREMTAMRFGRDKAIEAHRYAEDAFEFVGKLVSDHGIECDYERTGTMLVATTIGQEKRVAEQLRIAEDWGIQDVESRTAAQLASQFKTDTYRAGMFDPHTALLNPARFTRGLYKLAEKAGAVVYERTPVQGVEEGARGFVISTPQGTVHADRVVFATNAFSSMLGLASKQTALLNHIIVTSPLTDKQLASIGWSSRCGMGDARNMQHYYRLTADNRILIGGGDITPVAAGALMNHDGNVFAHLKGQLSWLFPQLAGIAITHRWSGPVSITMDVAPAIGTLGQSKRALFAVGLTGHGVSMAPYNGLCLAELLAGEESKRTESFFVGRRTLPWPPSAVRIPILRGVRGVLRLEDRLRWG